jgi:hypothetical protein
VKNASVSIYPSRSPQYLDVIPLIGNDILSNEERIDVLIHPAGQIVLSESAARLVVGAPVGLDAFQITRNNVLALS